MIDEVIEKLNALLQGKIPEEIETAKITDSKERTLTELLNRLITSVRETHEFIFPLAKGQLDEITLPAKNNFLGSPFKELHSRLLHLTWQAKQVAHGDYSQRVDFMGDFSEAFNFMIVSLADNEKILRKKIDELEQAITHITKLEGILPICCNCKKIRLEEGNPQNMNDWVPIESYISKKTITQFSHSICPDCARQLYPDIIK